MPQNQIFDSAAVLTGEDAHHISAVLRLAPGDALTVCSGGTDYDCVITSVGDKVEADIVGARCNTSEPSIQTALFMALPKGDKFEQILQKTVELGIFEIFPVMTERCVARPSEKSFEKKLQRYSAISTAAAKQAGRGLVPKIHPLLSFEQALAAMAQYEARALLYELAPQGGLERLLAQSPATVAFMVGPEGGFSRKEAQACAQAGLTTVGLGQRILRCETAPVAFLSVLMHRTGNLG